MLAPVGYRAVPLSAEQREALERALRERTDLLSEALDGEFERLHPRGRTGRWIKKLALNLFEVGGAVRDPLLGKEPKDVDYMAMASPQEIKQAVQAAGGRAEDLTVRDRLVGVRAHHEDLPPEGIEIAPPRIENSTGAGRHDFEIVPHPAVAATTHFHTSAPENRHSISTHGLRANWDPEVDDKPSVFVTPEPEQLEGEDVWAVETGGLPLEPDPWGEHHPEGEYLAHVGGSFAIPQDVAPERVSLYRAFEAPPRNPIADDAHRRDFTINALYRNAETGEIEDPTGMGLADLSNRLLRTTHPDSFRDDPLRILRGARFASQHNLDVEPETFEQMREHADAVTGLTQKGVSGTVREEMDKLLMGENPGKGLRVLRDSGALAHLFPELAPLIGFDQQSKYHNLTADEHTFMVVDEVAALGGSLEARLAALFHDSGKPESAWMGKDGRLHYYARPLPDEADLSSKQRTFLDHARKHKWVAASDRLGGLTVAKALERKGLIDIEYTEPREERLTNFRGRRVSAVSKDNWIARPVEAKRDHALVGEEIAEKALRRMNYPTEVIDDVKALVREHMLPEAKKPTGSKARKLRTRLMDKQLADLFVLRGADLRSKGEDDDSTVDTSGIDALEQMVANNASAPRSVEDLEISGSDLLERGWKPGPGMGRFLKEIFGEVIGQPELNNRDWLLVQAEKRRRKFENG